MIPATASLLTAVAALGAVCGLIWLVRTVACRTGHLRFLTGATAGSSARLAIVQSLALDQRRRLQLVRCDGQHFLLLTGGPQDLMLGFVPGADRI